jgi:hypothetical protein
MTKQLGLAIMIFALSAIAGCAQAPVADDTKVAPVPESVVTYARGAVEVGRIKLSQMPEFEASVEQMNLGERTALWLTLKELHDSVHPSQVVEHATLPSDLTTPIEETGCARAYCSHSDTSSLVVQWCCAFGENALFWAWDEDLE